MLLDAAKILVVDDDEDIVELLKRFLEGKNYRVLAAYDGEEALRQVHEAEPQVVLLDISLPGKDGLEVLREIKERHPSMGVIMITGIADEEVSRRALGMGAFDYIRKPFDLTYLDQVLWWQLKIIL